MDLLTLWKIGRIVAQYSAIVADTELPYEVRIRAVLTAQREIAAITPTALDDQAADMLAMLDNAGAVEFVANLLRRLEGKAFGATDEEGILGAPDADDVRQIISSESGVSAAAGATVTGIDPEQVVQIVLLLWQVLKMFR